MLPAPADARAEWLLAESEVPIGCFDAGTFKPRRIPNAVTELLT